MYRNFALSLLAATAIGTVAGPAMAHAGEVQTRYVKLAPGVPGVLYEPAASAKKGIGIFVMHANNDYLAFPPCTQLSERGYTVLCANNSTNKINAVDEGQLDRVLAEAKEGVAWLRKQPGIAKVVLFGHSGGATVMSAYQMIAENGVAACQQPVRLSRCPDSLAGLPAADGVMLIDSNWGQAGMVLLSLDASILDEGDGKRTDPSLDIYAPANGWSKDGAHYAPAFLARYQKAQAARNNRLIDAALARVAAIDAGKGMFLDDEPFTVPGASFLGYYNRLFPQDTSLMAHTRKAWPLLKGDGSEVTQIVSSVRPASGATPPAGYYQRGALRTSVRNFLSTYAVRAKPDFGYDADMMRGIDWDSSYAVTPGNAGHFKAPLLTMGMTGSYEYIAAETIHDRSPSPDKTIAFVEGATHNFEPCVKCEKTPGQYGDTMKRLFDYIDRWLGKPGRFLP